MIVDSSVVVAILLGENEADGFGRKIANAAGCSISVVNYVEASMVMEGRGGNAGGYRLDNLLREMRIELAPVTLEQAELARDAWRRFGRGNHPAALNLGDCFSYALAKDTGEPLLFKGNDFTLTDIPAA
ncbi:MAG: type II toxin-antitoxin system VapC family toxin [Chloroflexi bacterium]|nr:type II toxin-antitoxin system VapC family toxin [Chloroflexota bacterium]